MTELAAAAAPASSARAVERGIAEAAHGNCGGGGTCCVRGRIARGLTRRRACHRCGDSDGVMAASTTAC